MVKAVLQRYPRDSTKAFQIKINYQTQNETERETKKKKKTMKCFQIKCQNKNERVFFSMGWMTFPGLGCLCILNQTNIEV